ncbi:MAG TPA: fibronectin type III domain-containing protein [Thermoanaerobaculia bacterium]|nr:fibronectin type III domain-containing protein [Thermoanaerobaculia bacterium]
MKTQFPRIFGLALLLALLAPAGRLFAAEGVKGQFRQEQIDAYQRVVQDPQYHALQGQLRGNLNNRAVVDRFLSFLPISPLAILQIEMELNRFELAIPSIIVQFHERWKQLHPDLAKRYYPEEPDAAEVDPDVAAAKALQSITAAATVDTNRNSAYNFAVTPTDYQGEIQVAVNPNNANQIVSAANTWDDQGGACGTYGLQAIFYSSDGGATWGYTCAPDGAAYGMNCAALGGGTFGSDPAVAWNSSNEVFLNYMLLCYNGSYHYSLVVARSADGGATWNAQGIVKNNWATTTVEDKNFYAIDNNASSPFVGRHYVCWDRSNNEKIAYSTNNGATWSEVDLPSAPTGGTDLGCDIAVQKDGTVHVIWDTLTCGIFTCSNEQTYYTRSTNGGLSWSSPVLVSDPNLAGFSGSNCPTAQDDRCIGILGAIDVDNSGGSCDGTLYVTYNDFPSGGNVNNSDIFVRRSTNGGSTWSSAVRVNDDGSGGRIQFHPFLVVDQSNGTPVVAWHDARNDANNRAVDFYVARSSTCGASFETNVKASQPSTEFNNSGISSSTMNSTANANYNPNQWGEYLGLDTGGGKAYVAWSDTRHYFPSFATETQRDNVGFVVVDLGAVTPPDITPPAPPTGLTATAGNKQAILDWNDNTETDLASYRVYRSTNSAGPFSLITTVAVSNFTNTGLKNNTTYFFYVTAVDTSGNESGPSNQVSATPHR